MQTDRRKFLKTSMVAAMANGMPVMSQLDASKHRYDIGAYYFPNWHVDPRNESVHGKGWTEWRLLQHAEPKFQGHQQPKIPLWGYEDESIPSVFERKIDTAADHRVGYFIFDWYWYEGKPFLNGGLEQGYLRARNNNRVKFCLMWANQDWANLFPAGLNAPRWIQYKGDFDRAQFDSITDYVIKHYFSHPSYFMIDGCPYFSIYEISHLVRSLGSFVAAASALKRFREKTQAAGHQDLHLNVVKLGIQNIPGLENWPMLRDLSCRSTTSYTWLHGPIPKRFPSFDYEETMQLAISFWEKAQQDFPIPYYPNVTMGWDSTPRVCQTDIFTESEYPFTPVMTNNTPEKFTQALLAAKRFVDTRGGARRIININAWNEWTEGSYLEPDTAHGMRYLQAIRDVFKV